MTVLITGLGGTLAPALGAAFAARGETVAGWDRSRVDPEDRAAGEALLDELDPTAVCHLAMGPEAWAAALAGWCRTRRRPFLFTSTAMVFDQKPDGPHRVGDPRTAKDDYGRYKIRCEDAVRGASNAAIVARIGWQIGESRGGNNMLEALYRMAEVSGAVRASRAWIPACSFMHDTADALLTLLDRGEPGVFHLDANAHSALDFPTIARRLARRHHADWAIEVNDDYLHDQRLPDSRVQMPPLTERLEPAAP
jgi:dTDP-4-dehydrorhamnose reductase